VIARGRGRQPSPNKNSFAKAEAERESGGEKGESERKRRRAAFSEENNLGQLACLFWGKCRGPQLRSTGVNVM
jgi:hypothetical protein